MILTGIGKSKFQDFKKAFKKAIESDMSDFLRKQCNIFCKSAHT